MVNGKRVGTLDRRLKQDSLVLTLPKGQARLDILVENLGRINFGKYLLQNKKGLTGKVLFAGNEVKHWSMYGLPFNNTNDIKYASTGINSNQPVILKGTFDADSVGDTYLDMQNWGKGVVWVNGHNLGRYWRVGPQQTVYVPVEWLKKKGNEIVVLELLQPHKTISAISTPILDKLQ
jgi:beta-galactosidase